MTHSQKVLLLAVAKHLLWILDCEHPDGHALYPNELARLILNVEAE
jgi:hypothetical protein